jgi:outer membrane lipoprotein-sorting protein
MKKLLVMIIICIFCGYYLSALTADEIIRKVDQNETFKTAKSTGSIIIVDRFGERKSDFIAYSEGQVNSLIEFTSVEEEGQKVLRVKDKMYLYFPDAEEVILLQGSALKEGLLGSDISYEDMAGDKDTLKNYTAELLGSEDVDGASCYKVSLNSKPKKKVAYASYIVWVDKTTFAIRKAEYFSLSGKKIKEMAAFDFKEIAGKSVATKMIMKDLLKKNSQTEMILIDIEVNIALPKDIFSLSALTF